MLLRYYYTDIFHKFSFIHLLFFQKLSGDRTIMIQLQMLFDGADDGDEVFPLELAPDPIIDSSVDVQMFVPYEPMR